MSQFILALDQGTTSSRAILFNRAGQIHALTQQEFPQIFPQPGWVEHDANEIWHTQLAVAQRVLKDNHISASDITAIGIANQRETTVLWNRRTGVPLSNAIVWQDRRTAAICDKLHADGHSKVFQQKTGLLLDPYFSGTKLQWLLDNIPNARDQARRGELAFGTIDSWLSFKLCGEHITDTSNASRTLLFNIHTMEWDDELLSLLNIPRSVLPRIVASSGIAGKVYASLFGTSIPLAGIAGDQQAGTFGQACHIPGMAKNTYGTGCFMLMNTGATAITSQNNLISTVGWSIVEPLPASSTFLLEGSVFMAGAIIQWLRDGIGMIQHSSEVEGLATSVDSANGVVLVPAFTGLGAPYWDPHARGALFGMTRDTTKAHIARAALESIAFQSVDLLDAMKKDSNINLRELRVDGGASCNNFLMQFQSDILGIPLVRPVVTETTALGAAYLAGLATGFWSSQQEIATQWQIERCFAPMMREDERTSLRNTWQKAIARSLHWAEE